jgi:hypothetical protein
MGKKLIPKYLFLVFLTIVIFSSFTSALNVNIPIPINYSNIVINETSNDTVLWNSNAWSDTRWRLWDNETFGNIFIQNENNKLFLDASDNLNLQALNQLKLISGENELIWDGTTLYPSASNTELGSVGNAWHGIYTADLITSQDIICGGSLLIGTGAIGVDYTIDFNGESNDAQIKWDEDGNYFRVNKGWWHFVPAGYTTDFTRYYDGGSVLRSYLSQTGTQKWTMQTGGVEKGNLQYTLPGGNIGIAVFNASGTGRSEINFVQAGGIQLRASSTSSAGNIGLSIDTSNNVQIPNGNLDVSGAINTETEYQISGTAGFTGTCVNITYAGGLAVSCND